VKEESETAEHNTTRAVDEAAAARERAREERDLKKREALERSQVPICTYIYQYSNITLHIHTYIHISQYNPPHIHMYTYMPINPTYITLISQ
jgi:hypothetical protein